jgi:polyisoprenoid-binding protein YceI
MAQGGSRLRGRVAALVWLACVALPLHAQEARFETIAFDSQHSHADFTVKVMWLFDTTGRFAGLEGEVDIDHFRSQAVVRARIAVDSVRMTGRDNEEWVKSPEFFDADAWPEIRFRSEGFPTLRLRRGGEVPGDLTVRGITRAVTFTILPSACASPGRDCPIEARAAIRRSDFGMRSRRGVVSDRVRLSLSIVAGKAQPASE